MYFVLHIPTNSIIFFLTLSDNSIYSPIKWHIATTNISFSGIVNEDRRKNASHMYRYKISSKLKAQKLINDLFNKSLNCRFEDVGKITYVSKNEFEIIKISNND